MTRAGGTAAAHAPGAHGARRGRARRRGRPRLSRSRACVWAAPAVGVGRTARRAGGGAWSRALQEHKRIANRIVAVAAAVNLSSSPRGSKVWGDARANLTSPSQNWRRAGCRGPGAPGRQPLRARRENWRLQAGRAVQRGAPAACGRGRSGAGRQEEGRGPAAGAAAVWRGDAARAWAASTGGAPCARAAANGWAGGAPGGGAKPGGGVRQPRGPALLCRACAAHPRQSAPLRPCAARQGRIGPAGGRPRAGG